MPYIWVSIRNLIPAPKSRYDPDYIAYHVIYDIKNLCDDEPCVRITEYDA